MRVSRSSASYSKVSVVLDPRPPPAISIDYSDARWSAFKRALKVRHRVTHPRPARDLDITDDELADCRASVMWVMTTLLRNLVEQVDENRRVLEEIEA